MAEEATFNSLKLNSGQPIEEFASVVMEKGRRLSKSDRDMTFKCIDGLPSKLAFFVRAGKNQTIREALHSAKLGEAHGYRAQLDNSVGPDPITTLSQRVQALEVNNTTMRHNKQEKINTGQRSRPSTANNSSCFKCTAVGYYKRQCNWNGEGNPSPQVRCQLCDQMGHAASLCRTLSRNSRKPIKEPCQICTSTEHMAKECPQLNASGLRTPRTSQA